MNSKRLKRTRSKRIFTGRREYKQLRDLKLCGTNFGQLELADDSFSSLTKLDRNGAVLSDFRKLSAYEWPFKAPDFEDPLRNVFF